MLGSGRCSRGLDGIYLLKSETKYLKRNKKFLFGVVNAYRR